jgi:hypothetical protein
MVEVSTNLAAASLAFSVLSFLVLTFGLIMWQFPDFANTIRGFSNIRTASQPGVLSNISFLATIGGALSPDISLLIGFVSDIMNGSFRYSVTSIVGIFAVILHWSIGRFIFGYKAPEQVAVESAITTLASSVTSAVTPTAPPAPVTESINIGVAKDETPPSSGIGRGLGMSIRKTQGPPSVISSLPGGLGKPAGDSGLVPNPPGSVSYTARERRGELGPIIQGARPTRRAAMAARDKLSKLTGGASYIQEKFNPCTIRGLGMFELTNSPMGIAALSSIFMIYLLDMIAKRSAGQIGGYVGFSVAVLGLNLYAYKEARCVADTSIPGILRGIALPSIIGLASGGIAYGVMKTNYPSFLPLDAEPFDNGTPGKHHARCGKPSENEFVCDAYKNGKKISSAVVS